MAGCAADSPASISWVRCTAKRSVPPEGVGTSKTVELGAPTFGVFLSSDCTAAVSTDRPRPAWVDPDLGPGRLEVREWSVAPIVRRVNRRPGEREHRGGIQGRERETVLSGRDVWCDFYPRW